MKVRRISLGTERKNIRTFSGSLRKKGTGLAAYGFVDDVFVPPDLLAGSMRDHMSQVSGIAVRAKNKKQGRLGWRAVHLI